MDKARTAATDWYYKHYTPVPVNSLCREVSTLFQEYTQRGGVRPFGVSMLVAG